jgi:hypothetical protein
MKSDTQDSKTDMQTYVTREVWTGLDELYNLKIPL